MKNLIIDVGNSAIKICSGNTDTRSIHTIKNYSYSKENFNSAAEKYISKYMKGKSFNKIGISVLNSDKKDFLHNFFSSVSDKIPEFINRKSDLPFKIKYGAGLGNDRICSIAGAKYSFNSSDILVIDFGTASTYTLMLNNILCGGIISPGIITSLNSLTDNTDLPEISLKFPSKLFTNNTSDNIRSGVLYQSLFTAESIIKKARSKYPGILVTATGGLSDLISEKTDLIDYTDRHLVLKGINYLLQL